MGPFVILMDENENLSKVGSNIIDLDRWLAVESEAVPDGRLFAHDVFISHRRFELPQSVVESLRQAGLAVVWDNDLDLRDRRVIQGVDRAMHRSRYVALFVSNTFLDSPWCRAEYLNAIRVEKQYGVQRAIVLCESTDAIPRIPRDLTDAKRFIVDGDGITFLSQLVRRGNTAGADEEQEAAFSRLPQRMLGHSTNALSYNERLNLLEQRLLFWAEQGEGPISLSTKDKRTRLLARHTLGDPITEPEIIFREVADVIVGATLFEPQCRKGIDAPELERVIRMCACVVDAYSKEARLNDLGSFEKWAFDYMLKPLLIAVERTDLRSVSASIYRKLCASFREQKLSREIPIYLQILSEVENGGLSAADAVAAHHVDFIGADPSSD